MRAWGLSGGGECEGKEEEEWLILEMFKKTVWEPITV